MSDTRAFPFRPKEQMTPPPARQVTDVAVMRFDGIYEVDPALMQKVPQQRFPNWDTLRIAHGREDHLAWMHRHWSHTVLSGQRILDQIDEADSKEHR
jgi:hypothetical protein